MCDLYPSKSIITHHAFCMFCQVGGPSQQQASVYEEFARCLPGFLPSSSSPTTSAISSVTVGKVYTRVCVCLCVCVCVCVCVVVVVDFSLNPQQNHCSLYVLPLTLTPFISLAFPHSLLLISTLLPILFIFHAPSFVFIVHLHTAVYNEV